MTKAELIAALAAYPDDVTVDLGSFDEEGNYTVADIVYVTPQRTITGEVYAARLDPS